MTMNQQPLHLDADTQFGERIVNGLYTVSPAVALTVPDTTDGTIVANLGYGRFNAKASLFNRTAY
jgi:acyl dehydratase